MECSHTIQQAVGAYHPPGDYHIIQVPDVDFSKPLKGRQKLLLQELNQRLDNRFNERNDGIYNPARNHHNYAGDTDAGIGKNRRCKKPLLVVGSMAFLTGLMAVGGAFYLWYDPNRQKDTNPKIAMGVGVGGVGFMSVGLGMAVAGMCRKSR